MIEKVNIFQIFPRFILEDTDGFAMCKALEAGLNYFLDKCNEGLKLVLDVDSMPEWRLDEMAWELNCLYDFQADVDIKRDGSGTPTRITGSTARRRASGNTWPFISARAASANSGNSAAIPDNSTWL